MSRNDLSEFLACWLVSLKHGSSSIEADVRDALERSESEADFVAECQGQLR